MRGRVAISAGQARAGRRSPNPPAPVIARVTELQHAAGNRATTALIQRELAMRPSALDPLLGSGGKLKAGLGVSSFGAVRGALVDYRKALRSGDRQAEVKALRRIEALATEWLNRHDRTAGGLDQRRRAVLDEVLDQVAAELAGHGHRAAQRVYVKNIQLGEDPRPRKQFALEAVHSLTHPFPGKGTRAGKEAAAHGITKAELAAIRIFTGDDYRYINPATAASASWLALQKGRSERLRAFSDEQLIEEGSLHTGVALQGLVKLPVYQGTLYRGASGHDPDAYQSGTEFSLASFASGTRTRRVAEGFAITSDRSAPVRWLFELHDHGARDIRVMSMVGDEDEVLLLPGTRFMVESVTDIPTPPHAVDDGGSWRLVKARGIGTPATQAATQASDATAAPLAATRAVHGEEPLPTAARAGSSRARRA